MSSEPFFSRRRIRSLNVALRQELILCLPAAGLLFQGSSQSTKYPEEIDTTIFRENTEDIYAGIEWESWNGCSPKVIDFPRSDIS